MSVPRISASSYSNTAPLIWSFLYGSQRGKIEIILDTAPVRSGELLANKRVDCALVPVIEYQRIDDILLVPNVCVGAKERVRSVCLVTKGEDLRDVKRLALDISSKTSVALTKIIFREFFASEPIYQITKPNLAQMLEQNDCALLIGDPALMIDEKKYRKFDLAETWRSFTGFGFVFAMWMTQVEKGETARKIDFANARDEGLKHLDEIIANYKTEIPLASDNFRKYLTQNISFSIDETMHKGLSLFYELADKHGLIEKNKPLKFL
ncbi:menaquinone biosynthesis protein [soil metagenome]|jgi:chorismate dehydratase|nr:menaquinone biosynthesis protein [Acidobacteriota bacterium]